MTDIELFLLLANPYEDGTSRLVYKTEFIGNYYKLNFTNGCQWMRGLKGRHKYETKGRGNSWTIKLLGFDNDKHNRSIRNDIKKIISVQNCVHTGFRDTTQNPIEVDHKNGRYNMSDALDLLTQKIEDFQPLCRQANLQKRSDCKKCKESNNRFDATSLGYKISVINGDLKYEDSCDGCYWFDPLKFKKSLVINNI
jgi:hypothetical protein